MVTHPERVMDQASGTTKGELARYTEQVAGLVLPYAKDRPLALVRCPQGNAHECFFQKRALGGFSDTVQRATVAGHEVIWIRDAHGLRELVQFNAVELHGWGARMPRWQRPDWIVMDLDPDAGLPFARVVEAAQELKSEFDALDLKSFVKTTGGKGLHVVVPLQPKLEWAAIKAFARALALAFAQRHPQRYLAVMTKARRRGRIFVDCLRNGRGATAVLPYSPRIKPGMTVALPVAWKDLPHLDPREFTVRSVPGLLKRRRRDPWAELLATRQSLPRAAVEALEKA